METVPFGSDLWNEALEKYAAATGLSVEIFDADGQVVLAATHLTPLLALFREYGFEPGLFAECARRCVSQTTERPAVAVAESHGLTVVGTSLMLEGTIVGAAVAGYAISQFSQVSQVQRWAVSAGVPFQRLWDITRRQAPVPERRLMLYGELLQVLGDALLRENHRTRQLQAADAAKDNFLAMLSHELRTPLAAIIGWAGILMKSESTEQMHKAAAIIERNAWLESKMVDDLLDVNLIAHGTIRLEVRIHDLEGLLCAAFEAIAQDIKQKAIRLELAYDGDRLLIEGDGGRLQQVFRNVLSNAVKFTPAGGRISVTLRREGEDALVTVQDTGKGIPPEFLPFVFDIFRQQEQGTRREHEGLGIGLALVKRLTELHNGSVSVASTGDGRGTEVAIRLPLATPHPDGALLARAQTSASALAGVSVLVVDDSEDTRESLRDLLRAFGADVSTACDGREGLERVRDARPDLVLCDLRMPRMDGFEFMRELTRSPGHPPVVAVSGLASDADRRRTRESGFEAHIKKPFDVRDVVAAALEALGPR